MWAVVVAFVKWIGSLFVAVFTALWDVVRDFGAWCLDQLMQVVVAALGAIDVSAMQQAGQWWSLLPAEVLNMLGLIGFGEAMAIIAAAIVIRLGLQLIPFTRLGS